jgi:hypothetical protein
VLKVKRGEMGALRSVAPRHRARIIPLLEIVERTRLPTIEAHLDTAFKDFARSVRLYPSCFLDAHEIAPDGEAAAAEVFERAATAGVPFRPVTGITRSADVDAALRYRSRGLGLRLSRQELEEGGLAERLQGFMDQHRLAPAETDIIIDLGPVEDLVAEGVAALAEAFLAEVPDHARWRTFTISACAFPMSLRTVERHSHSVVPRLEWMTWKQRLYGNRRDLLRLPTFSDCAIQHPAGVEHFDPVLMPVSAVIRYAREEDWLLVKGESTRQTLPSHQFPRLASRLVYGDLRSSYAGAPHCAGCVEMKAAADGAEGLGSAEVWRRLGTVHHITVVMDELASLPWL